MHTFKKIQYERITLQSKFKPIVLTQTMGIEPELLSQSASGNKQAQYLLYKQSYSLLMSICNRYAQNIDDAKALLNLGFLKILLNVEKRKTNVPPELWMRRVMINCVIDEFRKNKNYQTYTQLKDFSNHTAAAEYASVVENEYDKHISSEALNNMLLSLPEMTAKVFNLFAIDGYSHKEIAAIFGISEGTSKWHVSSARSILRAKINEQEL